VFGEHCITLSFLLCCAPSSPSLAHQHPQSTARNVIFAANMQRRRSTSDKPRSLEIRTFHLAN
jgi:hypothetical protein